MAKNMKMRGWGVGTMAGVGVLAAWFVACAGEDIPAVDEDLRGNIEAVYPDDEGGDGQQGQAGSAATPPGDTAGSGSDSPTDEGAASGAGGRAPSGGGGTPVAAAGSGPVAAGGNADVCDAYNTIIVPRCGTAGCHNAGSSQGAFAIDGDEAGIAAFVDKPSTLSACQASYIDSGDIESSLLFLRTTEDFPQGCGNLQMPLIGDLLSPEETTCLQDWLTQFEN